MKSFPGIRHCGAALFFVLAWPVTAISQEALDYCGQTIRIGVRDDAPPFSYAPADLLRDPAGHETAARCGPAGNHFPDHAGFTIGVCDSFFDTLDTACDVAGQSPPRVEVVSLTAQARIAALTGNGPQEVDLLCGATTATVWLSGRLPHTLHTFVTPTRALLSERFGGGADGACRIGVVGGTTSSQRRTENTLLAGWQRFVNENAFCGAADAPPIISRSYVDYPGALADLLTNRLDPNSDLLLADHHIIRWYQENLPLLRLGEGTAVTTPRIDPRSFTLEPYAIFGGHDDQRLITLLNLHLAQQQRDGTFRESVASCFGRRIDQSLIRLLEIQKRTPLGNP